MMRFDQEDARRLEGQYLQLAEKCPEMFAILATAQMWVNLEIGGDLVVTSIFRPEDTDSVHGHWRGVDLRIYNPARQVADEQQGLWEDDAQLLCNFLDKTFYYGQGKSVAIIHGVGLDRHIHLQAPNIKGWR